MKTNFLNQLNIKEGRLLSRNELKTVFAGGEATSTLDGGTAAGIVITCDDGSIRTCSGSDCTGTDGVGCSCDGGTVSESC